MRGRREPSSDRARRSPKGPLAGTVRTGCNDNTLHHHCDPAILGQPTCRKSTIWARTSYIVGGNAARPAFRQRHGGLEPAPSLWKAAERQGGVTFIRAGSDSAATRGASGSEAELQVRERSRSKAADREHPPRRAAERGTRGGPTATPGAARSAARSQGHVGTRPLVG